MPNPEFNQSAALDALNRADTPDINAFREQVRTATAQDLARLVEQLQNHDSGEFATERFTASSGDRNANEIRRIITERARELRLNDAIGPWHTINENIEALRTRVNAEVVDAHNTLRNIMNVELSGPGPEEYGLALYNALKTNDAGRMERFGKILDGKFMDHGQTPPREVQFPRPNLAALEAFCDKAKKPDSEVRLGITERDAIRNYVNGQLLTNPREYVRELARYPKLKDVMNDTSLNDIPSAISGVTQPVASAISGSFNALTALLPSGVGAFFRDMRDGLLGAHPLEQAKNLGHLISNGASKLLWGAMANSPIAAVSRMGKKHQALNRVEAAITGFKQANGDHLHITINRNAFINAYTPPATGAETAVWEDLVNRYLQTQMTAGAGTTEANAIVVTLENLRANPTELVQKTEKERTAKEAADKERLAKEAQATRITRIKTTNNWPSANIVFEGTDFSVERSAAGTPPNRIVVPATGNHFNEEGQAISDEARVLVEAARSCTNAQRVTITAPEVPLEITRRSGGLDLKLPKDSLNVQELNNGLMEQLKTKTEISKFSVNNTLPLNGEYVRLSFAGGGRSLQWNGRGPRANVTEFIRTDTSNAATAETTWKFNTTVTPNTWQVFTS
jgi:hypothetical protein